jgi:hypothetical protein
VFETILEMRLSRRNQGPTVVIVNESFKLSLFDDGEACEEQVRDYLVANKETIDKTTWNNGRVKKFGKDGRYRKSEQRPCGKWWKNHILLEHGEERWP